MYDTQRLADDKHKKTAEHQTCSCALKIEHFELVYEIATQYSGTLKSVYFNLYK